MSRYLIGTDVIGADAAQAVLLDRAEKAAAERAHSAQSSDGGSATTIIALAISGIVLAVAWPWISRNM